MRIQKTYDRYSVNSDPSDEATDEIVLKVCVDGDKVDVMPVLRWYPTIDGKGPGRIVLEWPARSFGVYKELMPVIAELAEGEEWPTVDEVEAVLIAHGFTSDATDATLNAQDIQLIDYAFNAAHFKRNEANAVLAKLKKLVGVSKVPVVGKADATGKDFEVDRPA